jgi:CBS domain-containing protein
MTGYERKNSIPKAKNIMSTDVVSITKKTPIYEAMELLISNEITGMPVVDDDMNLVGVITEKDCLRLFYADEEERNKTVRYFMTQPAVHYNKNDGLETILTL